MTFIPDLSERLYFSDLAEGPFRYLSVGWLGDSVTSCGETSADILRRLEGLASRNYLEDHFLGSHTCEICGTCETHGQFFVERAGTRYLIPLMVFHYVRDHSYKLPEVVEAALLDAG